MGRASRGLPERRESGGWPGLHRRSRRPEPKVEDGGGGALLFRDAKPGLYARRRKRVTPQPLPARPVSAPSRSSRKAEGEALELGDDLTMATRPV